MSLLIKALASAEKDKQAELNKGKAVADLTLEPIVPETILTEPMASGASQAQAHAQTGAKKPVGIGQEKPGFDDKDGNQKAAANVFIASQPVNKPSSPLTLLALGVAGALIIWSGLQGYQYISRLNVPQLTIKPAPQLAGAAKPASQPAGTVQEAESAAQGVQADHTGQISKTGEQDNTGAKVAESAFITDDNAAAAVAQAAKKPSAKKARQVSESGVDSSVEPSAVPAERLSDLKPAATLKLVSKMQATGVDPVLLAAYQAFSRGDDASAQKQYRQVLQGDVRNVDALLGMAAIALRQSRYADANGWYQKVLEIEPRNTIALSATANAQIGSDSLAAGAVDYAGTESRIKNMLAQQPEAATLHAALGNLYAAQSQWAQAQAAYFNASRYAPGNADYAFNLAVSLDQLGKPGLALAQYQRALDLLSGAGAAGFDKAQLEARIQALQH